MHVTIIVQPSQSDSPNPWPLAFGVAIIILSVAALFMWRVGMLDEPT